MRRFVVVLLLVPVMVIGQRRDGRGPVPPPPSATPSFQDLIVKFDGHVKSISKKEILIDLDDKHELVAFLRTKETKFMQDGAEVKGTAIDLETHVTVEAKQDAHSRLKAVTVRARSKNATE